MQRLGEALTWLGVVLWFPALLLSIPLAVLIGIGLVSNPSDWVWLIPGVGWCIIVVGLMLSDEEGVLASAKKQFVGSSEKQRLTDDLPVGRWVPIATASDGDGDGDGDGGDGGDGLDRQGLREGGGGLG